MKLAILPAFLLLLSRASANLLESYQQRIVNYTATIDEHLLNLRSTNGAPGLQLTHQTLREFANFTLEMRFIAEEAWRFIEDFETDSDWCKDYIRTIFDVYVEIGENDIKTCAARWTRSVSQDASERFWPLAGETQQWNSQGVSRVLEVLRHVEQVLDWDEVESELQVVLGDIEDGWVKRREQLDDEIGQHGAFAETVLRSLDACVEEAIFWQHIFMDYAMDMAHMYC